MRKSPTPALQKTFDKHMRTGSYNAAAGLLDTFPNLTPKPQQHALLQQRSPRYAQSLRGQQPAPVRFCQSPGTLAGTAASDLPSCCICRLFSRPVIPGSCRTPLKPRLPFKLSCVNQKQT